MVDFETWEMEFHPRYYHLLWFLAPSRKSCVFHGWPVMEIGDVKLEECTPRKFLDLLCIFVLPFGRSSPINDHSACNSIFEESWMA